MKYKLQPHDGEVHHGEVHHGEVHHGEVVCNLYSYTLFLYFILHTVFFLQMIPYITEHFPLTFGSVHFYVSSSNFLDFVFVHIINSPSYRPTT